MKLIVFTLSLDQDNMVFSHHRELLEGLSSLATETFAVSFGKVNPPLGPGISVHQWRWRPKTRFYNALNILFRGVYLLARNRNARVVFLQADFLSALLSPFCFFMRIPCYLWYAHQHISTYLRFSMPFLSKVLTANPESCEIESSKVRSIGHCIDSSKFDLNGELDNAIESQNFFHLGRCDASKNLGIIVAAVSYFGKSESPAKLFLLGEPTTSKDSESLSDNLKLWMEKYPSTKICRTGKVKRADLPNLLSSMGIFVHAFQGSLDKAILESTLLGNPVATLNRGYVREFGQWSKTEYSDDVEFLRNEINSIVHADPAFLKSELVRRRDLALSRHSLASWLTEISYELEQG